jgi:hypothetical protein
MLHDLLARALALTRTHSHRATHNQLHSQPIHLRSAAPACSDSPVLFTTGNSDWTIHRGGAVTFEGVADVSLKASMLSALGGNAVFISNDAKNVCYINLWC